MLQNKKGSMNIKDAKVIITGASSGIGYETAKVLKEHGATVLISARNQERLENAAKELGVPFFKADVSKENDVQSLFKYAIQELGDLNVLVNNAGIGRFASLTETSLEDFQAQWEVNTKGLFLAGKEAANYFIEKKYGNIINIGSTAAVRGFAKGSAYVASKFAVSGLTQCWRSELRPYNIRVTQINPSEVVTAFIEKAGLGLDNTDYKLKASEIGHTVVSILSMSDIGFIPSVEVWATNPNRK